jgi:hypothetical protein
VDFLISENAALLGNCDKRFGGFLGGFKSKPLVPKNKSKTPCSLNSKNWRENLKTRKQNGD